MTAAPTKPLPPVTTVTSPMDTSGKDDGGLRSRSCPAEAQGRRRSKTIFYHRTPEKSNGFALRSELSGLNPRRKIFEMTGKTVDNDAPEVVWDANSRAVPARVTPLQGRSKASPRPVQGRTTMAMEETSVKVRLVTVAGVLIGKMSKPKSIRTLDALNL